MSGVQEVLANARQWAILQGDALQTLRTLPDGCVHVCCTSPPYYALRSYLPNGHPGKAQEMGSEATPDAFVARLVEVFREVRRVLHPTGCVWVNLGDSYTSGGNGPGQEGAKQGTNRGALLPPKKAPPGHKPKDLLMMPARLALALRDDGWWLRSECVWVKPAPMPQSLAGWRWERCRVKVGNLDPGARDVRWAANNQHGGAQTHREAVWQPCPGCPRCERTGGLVLRKGSWRPTTAHEAVFLLAKSETYFADGEPVRTAAADTSTSRYLYGPRSTDVPDRNDCGREFNEPLAGANLRDWWRFPGERLYRVRPDLTPQEEAEMLRLYFEAAPEAEEPNTTVMTISPEPTRERHYATFPSELPSRCIKAATSERGVCPACGMPWARVVERTTVREIAVGMDGDRPKLRGRQEMGLASNRTGLSASNSHNDSTPQCPIVNTTGWLPTCPCDAGPPVPAVVLDIFAGISRTGVAARRLGRRYIGIDLSESNCRAGERQLRHALDAEPAPPAEDAMPLFDDWAGRYNG